MQNKFVLITGSTDGIGKETAKEFAKKSYNVIIHGRDSERVENTKQEIIEISKNKNIFSVTADFASFKEIVKMAEELNSKFRKIDLLYNNAALFSHERILTENQNELTFQVNHLAMHLLTLKLENLLKNSGEARVINVSSMIHASSIDFENLQGEKNYNGNSAYALSKLCNIMFTNKLADIYTDFPITANSLHPGVIKTKLLNAAWTGGGLLSEGANNMIYAGTSEVIKNVSGLYLENGRPMQSNPISYNKEFQNILWEKSNNLLSEFL